MSSISCYFYQKVQQAKISIFLKTWHSFSFSRPQNKLSLPSALFPFYIFVSHFFHLSLSYATRFCQSIIKPWNNKFPTSACNVHYLNTAAACKVSYSNCGSIRLCRRFYQRCQSAASSIAVENSRQLHLLLTFLAPEMQKFALLNQRSFISFQPLNTLQLTRLLFRNNFLLTLSFVPVQSKIKNWMFRAQYLFPTQMGLPGKLTSWFAPHALLDISNYDC